MFENPATVWGSSPHTRGKPRRLWVAGVEWGLIPTHAGKTPSTLDVRSNSRAHPHTRGENGAVQLFENGVPGSSPHTRGKQPAILNPFRQSGLIPTHAGKTTVHMAPRWVGRAHPHTRGENFLPPFRWRLQGGSSPHTRGKLRHLGSYPPYEGLIPTHAGKTATRPHKSEAKRAHPHTRGENELSYARGVLVRGSSPHTRGKLIQRVNEIESGGLIPTHAGKTTMTRQSTRR